MFRLLCCALASLLTAAGTLPAAEAPLRDPTRPYQAAPQAGPGQATPRRVELSAVLVSTKRRIAVIDGRFYRVGDRVGGAEILKIEPEFVQLRRGNETFEVRLIRGSTGAVGRQGDPAS